MGLPVTSFHVDPLVLTCDHHQHVAGSGKRPESRLRLNLQGTLQCSSEDSKHIVTLLDNKINQLPHDTAAQSRYEPTSWDVRAAMVWL